MIGRTLGNYRIVEQAGVGGMATVYKAYDPDTDRYVAIKILPHQFSQDPTFRERFHREAKAIARLEHLHILPIFAYGEEEGIAYMAMRYLRAGTLTDRIRQGALPLDEANRLLGQIAGALDHAHANGVLHRDIKPSNVLLDSAGNAFLTDFGIAKMVEATIDLTAGGILGTPAYMSPEQCRGQTELTPATDQYSLGIVLYEMVTGRTPFLAETPIALIHMQLNDPLPLPRKLRPDLPEAAERVILKALSKEPQSRYQSCGAMAAAFAQAVAQVVPRPAVEEEPTLVSAMPAAPTRPEAGRPATLAPARRFRLPAWAIGLAAVLVIAGAVGAAVFAGLFSTGQEAGQTEVKPATSTPARGAEAALPPSPVPSPTPSPVPSPTPVPATASGAPPLLPPLKASEVKPCEWDNRGAGLCIGSLRGGTPTRILEEANLTFTGSPSWSPDGRQIAFSAVGPGESGDRDSAIYIANVDGADLTKLPQIGNDVSPAWSPDGKWLAFHSSCDLAVMRPDGSDASLVWHTGGQNQMCAQEPEWSADSRWLVFSATPGDGDMSPPLVRQVAVLAADGSTQMFAATTTHKTKECMDITVAFSPDGKSVAYVDENCRPRIRTFAVVGPDYPALPEFPDDFPVWWTGRVHPQWGRTPPVAAGKPSLKGKIAQSCPGTRFPQICIEDVLTGQVTPVTDNLEFEQINDVSWSPDGQELVFDAGASDKTGVYDHKIYRVGVDGSNLRPVTRGKSNDVAPAWSPDGEWIAFHRNCDLWIVRPDGSGGERLLKGSDLFCAASIVWSPNSRQIALVNLIFPSPEALTEVLVINRDGTDAQILHSFDPPREWVNIAWTPDGTGILCWYEDKGQTTGLLFHPGGPAEPEVISRPDQFAHRWRPNYWPPWGGEK